jgi:hypothetical protein
LTGAWFVNNVPRMELPQYEGVLLQGWIDANGHTSLADHVGLLDQPSHLRYDRVGAWQVYREATEPVRHMDMSGRLARPFPADLPETISAVVGECRERAVSKRGGYPKVMQG